MSGQIAPGPPEIFADVMPQWFGRGCGDYALADDVFSSTFSTSGITVGPSGPKRDIANRLVGRPGLATTLDQALDVRATP